MEKNVPSNRRNKTGPSHAHRGQIITGCGSTSPHKQQGWISWSALQCRGYLLELAAHFELILFHLKLFCTGWNARCKGFITLHSDAEDAYTSIERAPFVLIHFSSLFLFLPLISFLPTDHFPPSLNPSSFLSSSRLSVSSPSCSFLLSVPLVLSLFLFPLSLSRFPSSSLSLSLSQLSLLSPSLSLFYLYSEITFLVHTEVSRGFAN